MFAVLLAVFQIAIPFRWTPGQIEVQVSVNGRAPAWFIVDTGAEYSIVSEALAKELRLARTKRGAQQFSKGVTLAFGGIVLRDQEVLILPLDNFRAQKRPIVGLIGYDFFARYVVTIDYDAKTLTAVAPDAFRVPKGAVSIPLRFDGRVAAVPVTLEFDEGKPIAASVTLDTGAQQALVLRHPFATKHALFERVTASREQGVVASKSVRFADVPLRRLTLAGRRFDNPKTSIYATTAGAGGYTGTDGLLGNEILRHFRVTVDYPRARVILSREDDEGSPANGALLEPSPGILRRLRGSG